MKKLIWSSCIVLMVTFMVPCLSFAVMHNSNSSLRFQCVYCHPDGIGGGLPKTPCTDCHKNSSGGGYTDFDTIQVATHSSTVIGDDKYGTWERLCVDCHWPHEHNGITLLGGVLDNSYVLADVVANQAITDPVAQTTTFTTMQIGTIYDPAWADTATWGQKTSAERGLLFVWYNPLLGKYYWYEIISATDTSITIGNASTRFKQAPKDNPVPGKIVYGMLLHNEVNEISVKFGDPKDMADDESATGFDPTPDGICQVCHTQTLHWRNDGSLADHFTGQNCIMCHPHDQGFKAAPPSSPIPTCE